MRYIVYSGLDYYPLGGAHDYTKVFNGKEEAITFARMASRLDANTHDWAHVADEAGKIYWDSEKEE